LALVILAVALVVLALEVGEVLVEEVAVMVSLASA
jgi:hypothetical protein